MTHSVTVRDTKVLERILGNGGIIPEIPVECVNNSIVIRTLLENFGARVYPRLSYADYFDFSTISHSVAYLMRPDILIENEINVFPVTTPDKLVDRFCDVIQSKEGKLVHLRRDPSILSPEFKLFPNSEDSARGAELFRCYSATLSWLPDNTKSKLGYKGNSSSAAFPLADMTAYLICKTDLQDYEYTDSEVNAFKHKVVEELKDI